MVTSPTYTAVLLLSLLSCVSASLGVALALALRANARALAAGMGFSVGIMILIAVLELVPQSIAGAGAGAALGSALAGAGLVWLAHLIIPHTHLVTEKGLARRMIARGAYLVALGLILHDVPEGFAMANAFVASPALGLFVALAIALHNLPEEFALAVPLVTLRSKAVLYGAALLSALAEPLGALVGLAAVGVAPALNAHFLGFAAGAMIFVSVHELVPMARRYARPHDFLSGILVSALAYALLALTLGRLVAI